MEAGKSEIKVVMGSGLDEDPLLGRQMVNFSQYPYTGERGGGTERLLLFLSLLIRTQILSWGLYLQDLI